MVTQIITGACFSPITPAVANGKATLRAECSFVAIELKHYIDTRRNTK